MSGSTRTLVVNFVGDSSKLDETVKQTTSHLSSLDKAASSLSNAAKSAVGLGVSYLGVSAAKSAIDNTEMLGESVLKLHGAYGLSIKDATAWSAQIQARGGDSKELMTSFRTLATQTVAAAGGSKTAEQAFRDLGISEAALRDHGNDLQWVLGKVSDGLEKLPAGTLRGADASKLLGRSYQTLIPLLAGGSAEMNKQLNLVAKSGVVFTGGVKNIEQFRQEQINLKLATMGLETTFTQQLAPTLLKIGTDVIWVINQLRPFKDEIEGVAAAVGAAWSINKIGGLFGIENTVGTALKAAFTSLADTSVTSAATIDASMASAATSVARSDAAIIAANDRAAASFTAEGAAGVGGIAGAAKFLGEKLAPVAIAYAAYEALKHTPGIGNIFGDGKGPKNAFVTPRRGETERAYIANQVGLPAGYKGALDAAGVIRARTQQGYPADTSMIDKLFTQIGDQGHFGRHGFDASSSFKSTLSKTWPHPGGINPAPIPVNKKLIEAAALAVQTAGITDRTKSATDAAAARTTVINDMQMLASEQLQAAAKNVTDAATVVQDKLTAAATAITDAATVRHDQSQIVLQGLQDASQTQTDLLGERGLQGFQLLAQKMQVHEDILKQGFDHLAAVQQKVVDQVKAHWDGTLAADATRIAMVTQRQDHLASLAQQHATQVQMHGDTLLGNANAKADAVQLATDINTALAQQAVTLATGSSKAKQLAASAALTLAQAQGAKGQAIAAQGLGNVTASTNLSDALAQGSYQRAQDKAALVIAGANAKLSRDTGAAARAEARANARLTGLQDKFGIAEQKLTDQVNLIKSVGGFYYVRTTAGDRNTNRNEGPSGSRFKGGLTINGLNIYGRNKTDARIVQDIWQKLRPLLNGSS